MSFFLNSGEVDSYRTALNNSTAITEQQLNPRFYWAEFSFSKIMICKLITLAIFCSTNLMQNNRTKFNSVEENETGNHSCDLYEVCMIAGAFFSHLAVCLAVWCSLCSTVLKCWPLVLNARVLLITSRLCFTSVKLKTPIQNIASRENKSLTTTGGESRWFHYMTGSTPYICSAQKGYLFQASGIWKSRDFTCWSIWNSMEICHFGRSNELQGLAGVFYGFEISGLVISSYLKGGQSINSI